VLGVDFTPSQVGRARQLVAELGLQQVEFHEGRIENVPVADGTVDCVVSNGVINLSPDKPRVFVEAARVLRPGGRMALADIVTERRLADAIVSDADLWAACIGGAAQERDYQQAIEAASLRITSMWRNDYEFLSQQARDAGATYGVKSISLLAVKPDE
jgi:ubiquinone/menaquinone biosynthesis C-methylase UbiE